MALSKALSAAGLKAPVRPRLRDEIWVKLWGNLSFNPISALTHATLDVLCTDEGTRPVARNMMLEAQAIAEKLGVKFPIDVDRRIDGGSAIGAHRTSMLQDLEQGRPMEIDALLGSVQELGRVTDTPTPIIDTVLALTKLRVRTAGLYGALASITSLSPTTAFPAQTPPLPGRLPCRNTLMRISMVCLRMATRCYRVRSSKTGCPQQCRQPF